ncbi:Uncharacterized protein FKW44_010260, partial [Caligus rogercresseyi]
IAMMLGVVSLDGNRMPPFWFPKGLKIGAKEYLEVMQHVVKPWLDATYPEGNYVFQQDSAPGHKAKITHKWCEETWQHSGHGPCGHHQARIAIHLTMASGAIPHASVDALKAAVEKEWAEMSVDFIVKTCKAFSPGSRPC